MLDSLMKEDIVSLLKPLIKETEEINFLLTSEDGSYLMLESNDEILLE